MTREALLMLDKEALAQLTEGTEESFAFAVRHQFQIREGGSAASHLWEDGAARSTAEVLATGRLSLSLLLTPLSVQNNPGAENLCKKIRGLEGKREVRGKFLNKLVRRIFDEGDLLLEQHNACLTRLGLRDTFHALLSSHIQRLQMVEEGLTCDPVRTWINRVPIKVPAVAESVCMLTHVLLDSPTAADAVARMA